MRVVLVPVKSLSNAKQRLAGVLTSAERTVLTWAMLRDVGRALAGVKLADRIVVVTDDAAVVQYAQEQKWEVLREGRQISESHSVDRASAHLVKQGATLVLRLPGDIPLIEPGDVDSLLNMDLPSKGALLVPSRDGSGTNALLRKPPDIFPSCFGPGSFELHQQQAGRAGVTMEVIQNPRIALDIDDITDLCLLWAQDRRTFTVHALAEMPITEKLSRTPERSHATP